MNSQMSQAFDKAVGIGQSESAGNDHAEQKLSMNNPAGDFRRPAVDAFLEASAAKAADKVAQNKKDAKAKEVFVTSLASVIFRARTVRQAVLLAVDTAIQGSEDSPSWFVSGLAQSSFWAYRATVNSARKAEQQAKFENDLRSQIGNPDDTYARDEEESVADLATELAAANGYSVDYLDRDEDTTSFTVDDVTAVVEAIISALNDVYLITNGSMYASVPLVTQDGGRVAFTLDQAMVLSESVLDSLSHQNRVDDKRQIRSLLKEA